MSERLSKPKRTLITEKIFDRLSVVQIGGGFGGNLKVERLNKKNHEMTLPEHLKAIVDPGDPQKQLDGSAGLDTYIRTYLIHVYLIPSQTGDTPIDEQIDLVCADVVVALCEDSGEVNPPTWTLDGLAEDTWAEDPQSTGPLPDSLAWLIAIPINVRYTTRERNEYLND